MQDHSEESAPPRLYTVSAGGFSAIADAFAFHADHRTLWFLSIIGPQTSVKAIAGTLLKSPPGQAHFIQGTDNTELEGPIIITIPSHKTMGTWTNRTQRLKDNAFHTILYTKWAEHNSDTPTFLILPKTEESAPDLHYQYLDKRTPLPLHPTWTNWLWQRGLLSPNEIIPLHSSGIKAYLCTPDHEALRKDISLSIATGMLPTLEHAPEERGAIEHPFAADRPLVTTNGHHPI